MLTIAACILTLKTLYHADNHANVFVRHYAKIGVTISLAEAERLRVVLESGDDAALMALIRESDRLVITDMGAWRRHAAHAVWSEHARLEALRMVGIEADAAMVERIREAAECDADSRIATEQ
jgi:hypothetical protein